MAPPGSELATPVRVAGTRRTVVEQLRGLLPELRRRYPLASLAVFGSWARGEQGPGSDLDLLVEFDGPVRLLDYGGLKAELEERLRVDLASRRHLKPALARATLDQAVPV